MVGAVSKDDYRLPPEEVNMAEEERFIRRNTSIALLATIAAFIAAYLLLPRVLQFPQEMPDRFALAAICWAIPCFVLLVAVMMVSTGRRSSAADIGGQAAGPPSEKLAVRAAFLQNTLEQAVLAGGFYFALAAAAGGAWLGLLPASATLFLVGRVLFYAGYRRGAKGRSMGMALTILPSALGYLLIPFLLVFAG